MAKVRDLDATMEVVKTDFAANFLLGAKFAARVQFDGGGITSPPDRDSGCAAPNFSKCRTKYNAFARGFKPARKPWDLYKIEIRQWG